jgi:hypothetical protein
MRQTILRQQTIMRQMMRTLCPLAAAAVGVGAACSGGDVKDARIASGAASVSPVESRPRSAALPERTTTRPASPCEWLPVSEVEAVVGALNGPPRNQGGGCFYPLPVDSITIARRAKARQVQDALARSGMKSDWPAEPEDTGGVLVQVSVGVGAEERAAELGFGMLGSWAGDDSLLAAQKAGDGWDYRRRMIGKPNFWGRAGTVMITVEGATFGMKDSVMAVLAGRVRDRIPDLPFMEPTARTSVPDGPDPCAILTQQEAEPVLGRLLVAPYRVRKGGALADPGGQSCAYYTGKHRALLLTPHYSDGAGEMRFARAGGGLAAVGVVDRAADAADTLEGPWDEVAIGLDGQLAMLTGNRMLEIAFLTSSTDITGAIRLARTALPRLSAVR